MLIARFHYIHCLIMRTFLPPSVVSICFIVRKTQKTNRYSKLLSGYNHYEIIGTKVFSTMEYSFSYVLYYDVFISCLCIYLLCACTNRSSLYNNRTLQYHGYSHHFIAYIQFHFCCRSNLIWSNLWRLFNLRMNWFFAFY